MIIFLQNAWSPLYANRVWPRRSWLRALARSRSGQRLRSLTDDFEQIHNASPRIGPTADSVMLPDEQHVLRVLDDHKPRIVVACGKYAESALLDLWEGALLCLPHPAHRLVTNQLYQMARCMLVAGYVGRGALRQLRGTLRYETL